MNSEFLKIVALAAICTISLSTVAKAENLNPERVNTPDSSIVRDKTNVTTAIEAPPIVDRNSDRSKVEDSSNTISDDQKSNLNHADVDKCAEADK
jgi:hypothetical protein